MESHSILLVDDDKDQRSLYSEIFKKEGFTVYEGNDGMEGMEAAQKHKPNIIFTGIMMPRMNGFEMMQKLRALPDFSKTPFLIFSHLGREEDRKKAAELGAERFFVKGMIAPIEIVLDVKNILEGKNVFKVMVNENKLDVSKIRAIGNVSGDVILELTPIPDQTPPAFTAKFSESHEQN